MFCSNHVAVFQCLPDLRRAYGNVINVLPWDFFHPESVFGAVRFQFAKASFAVLAKPMIITDYELLCADPVNENVPDELHRCDLREFFRERYSHQVLYILFFQESGFFSNVFNSLSD